MSNVDNNTVNSNVIVDLQPQASVSKPKNALVHGIYASEIVLPWESEEDFETLHKELKTEWGPDGRTEEEAVLTLARWTWLRHRLMRTTQMAFRKDPFVIELEKAGAKNWPDVERVLKSKADADDGVMDEARKTLEELKNATQNASDLMTATNPNTVKVYDQMRFINDMFVKHVIPVYGKAFERSGSSKAVEEAYTPDYLEKIVRLEASLDARIDKTLSRLVILKEYKRQFNASAPKTISSPAIAPASVEK